MSQNRFCIVIPSYNNELFCENNMLSVLGQEYSDYRIVFVNDASTDKTKKKVEAIVAESSKKKQVAVIHREKRLGALRNIYEVVHQADDDEIILVVDGDDWLYNEKVLFCLDQMYSQGDVWLTYGQYIHFPSMTPGHCQSLPTEVLKNQTLRNYPWVTSHLKTFFAGLFKKISKEDLLHEGNFFSSAWDLAFMFPMLEMAGMNSRFIEEPLYAYNGINPISDGKARYEEQQKMGEIIRALEPYSPL